MKPFFTVLLLLLLPLSMWAQRVAIVGINNYSFSGTRDGFAFVALEDIPSGTKIFFTEQDYSDASNSFSNNTEAVTEWTASGTLSAGCVVVIHEVSSNSPAVVATSGGCNGGSVTANYGSFSIAASDPIYAFASTGSGSSSSIVTNVMEIYSAGYINGGTFPSANAPSNDYPNAIVWAVNAGSGAAQYKPSLRSDPTSSADLETSANYDVSTGAAFDPLSSTIFSNVGDGCGPGNDNDMDGTCNDQDGCPNDPNKIAPGTCGCGNPEPGTPCDDGDECTINDVIKNDCSCAGTYSEDKIPVAVIGVNNYSFNNSRDGFSFVALADIPDGTKIFFTESNYNDTNNGFNVGSEGVTEWTASGTLERGCVVVIHEQTDSNDPAVVASSPNCNGGSVTAAYGTFSIGTDDPIYAFASNGSGSSGSILGGLTEVYSVITLDGSLPPGGDPSNDYERAIVTVINVGGPGAAEFAPSVRDATISGMDIENPNLYNFAGNSPFDPLTATPFANAAANYCCAQGDTDMDGTCNDQDGCPNDPNKIDPGTCGCGNPEPGDVCDDGDPCTFDDTVQADCSCAGTPDTTPPTVTCNGSIAPVDADANCMFTVADILSGSTVVVTDNCDANPMLSQSPLPGILVGLGNTIITITATDSEGNMATCTYTLTVEDNTPPTITCPGNQTFTVDETCMIAIPDYTTQMGDVLASSTADFSGTQGAGGWQYGRYFAFDAGGFTQNSYDATNNFWPGPQSFATPYLDQNGGHPGVDDLKWAVRRWTSDFAGQVQISGDFFDRNTGCGDGAHVRILQNGSQIYEYLNVPSGSTTYSQSTTLAVGDVLDFVVDPKFDGGCDDTHFTATIVAIDGLTTSDNCGAVTVTQSPAPGTMITGTSVTTVILTADDGNGNTTMCDFLLTARDTTPPVITCQDITLALDANGSAGFQDFINVFNNTPAVLTRSDNCGVGPDAVILGLDGNFSFSCARLGDIPLTVIVQDNSSNEVTCNITLTITDPLGVCNQPPVANCKDLSVNADAICQDNTTVAADFDMGSSDPDGDALSFSIDQMAPFALGTTNVVLTVSDGMLSDTCQTTITVEDNTNPTATCPGDMTVDNDPGQCGANVFYSLSVNENCPGVTVDIDPSDNFFTVGTTQVTATATDASGNIGSCSFNVTVNDAEDPMATCPGNIMVDNDPGECGAEVTFNIDVSDNCPGATVEADPPSGSFFPVGTTTVTVTATDASGNTDQCTFDVMVNDTEVPMVDCTAEIMVDNDPGLCEATIDLPIPDTSDNCGIVSFEYRFVAVDEDNNEIGPFSDWFDVEAGATITLDVGRFRIRFRADDAAGNRDGCNQFVTVTDAEDPLITACAGTTVNFNGEDSFNSADVIDFAATDNCEIVSTTFDPPLISCEELGTTVVVTVTVTDAAGNSESCMANVVVDGLPCGFMLSEIGCQGDADYDVPTETFTLEATNCLYGNPFHQDELTYVKTELCGSGEFIAEVDEVEAFAWAGIMMRETLAQGSKKIALSRDNGFYARREARSATNGPAYPQQFPVFGKNWLRLVRNGNQFIGYVSPNGVQWQQVMVANISMDQCIYVGLFLTNKQPNQTVTADFRNVEVNQGHSGMSLQQLPTTSLATPADVSVYPNPTAGLLTVDLGVMLDMDVQLELRNTNGQVLRQLDLGRVSERRTELQLGDLPTGIYWLRVQAEGQAPITKRIVVQRP